MRRNILFAAIFLTGLFFLTGCDDKDHIMNFDNTPPAVPTGVQTSNGDGNVYITWEPNRDKDIAGYNVYYSNSYDGKYKLIGSTETTGFYDNNLTNGQKYYYAVTAYDYNDNESALSREDVYGIGRPQRTDQKVYEYKRFPSSGGYSCATFSVVTYNSNASDFYYEVDSLGYAKLNVFTDSDIADMGATNSIYDITAAPTSGWSPTYQTSCVPGHTYVIRTMDMHFAKIRVKDITRDRVNFDVAYQTIAYEEALSPGQKPGPRYSFPAASNRIAQ